MSEPDQSRPTPRRRIRWLIKGLGPGGAETLLVSLARSMDLDRFDIEIDYLLPWKDHLVADLREAGVRVRCLGVDHPGDVRWITRFLEGIEEVDVVHVHSPLLAGMIRPVLRLRSVRPAIVSTEHNRWESFPAVSRLANRLTHRLNDATVAVSADVRRSMGTRARSAEILVHGIELDVVRRASCRRDEIRRELGIEPGRHTVLTIANLRPNKAYPDLLRAARAVIDTDPSIDFFSIGQGPAEHEVHALADGLGLGDRFRFLGFRAAAYRYLAGADLFVLASRHEGYPVAVMEAMASGTPVVATAVGGVPEAIRDGIEGRLVPAARPEELASAILDVMGDESLRDRMARSARERSRLFDVARAADRVAEIYDSVVVT